MCVFVQVYVGLLKITPPWKAFSDGECAVVADSLFHNLTVGLLGKNENVCWSIFEWGM